MMKSQGHGSAQNVSFSAPPFLWAHKKVAPRGNSQRRDVILTCGRNTRTCSASARQTYGSSQLAKALYAKFIFTMKLIVRIDFRWSVCQGLETRLMSASLLEQQIKACEDVLSEIPLIYFHPEVRLTSGKSLIA